MDLEENRDGFSDAARLAAEEKFKEKAADVAGVMQQLNSLVAESMRQIRQIAEVPMQAVAASFRQADQVTAQLTTEAVQQQEAAIGEAMRQAFLNSWSSVCFDVADEDLRAVLALLHHMEKALGDPDIKASKKVFNMVSEICRTLGELDAVTAKDSKRIAAAFSRPALSETNSKNAKQKRLKSEYSDAEELCKKWFADPTLYKNKAAFFRDVIAKEWCKDSSTASRWFNEFRKNHAPGTDWLAKFDKKNKG